MTIHIRFEWVTPSSVDVRGWKSMELLTEVTGRRPQWSRSAKAWNCQPSTAVDAIGLAESRGWDVTITGERSIVRWASSSDDEAHQHEWSWRGTTDDPWRECRLCGDWLNGWEGVADATREESSSPEQKCSPPFVDSGLW